MRYFLFKERKQRAALMDKFLRGLISMLECLKVSFLAFHSWFTFNDLTEGLTTKLFADDASLFSVVNDTQSSATDLNKDLAITIKWAFQGKINFNLDPIIKPKKSFLFFIHKANKLSHLLLVFHNVSVSQSSSQKHLPVLLYTKLIFNDIQNCYLQE